MAWPNRETFEWNEDRVIALTHMWANPKMSASMIAGELGTSRNSVIGKIHRLGLSGRPKNPFGSVTMPRRPKTDRITRRIRARQERKQAGLDQGLKFEPEPEAEEPIGPRVSITQLTEATCRWPYGDPRSEDFCYCGHPTKPESVYCEHHFARSLTGFGKARYGSTPPAEGYVCKGIDAAPDYADKSLKSLSF